MEFLCALATAISYWALMLNIGRGLAARTAAQAGRLLLVVKRPYYWLWQTLTAIPGVGMCCIGAYFLLLVPPDERPGDFAMLWLQGTVFAGLVLLWPPSRLQLREKGILVARGSFLQLIPWSAIKYAKWRNAERELFVQLRHEVMQWKIPLGRAAEVTALLAERIEVRNLAGEVIPSARRPAASEEADEGVVVTTSRFQFDLRSLFLLMFVVATGASWYGLIYRRQQPERDALARLERFSPDVNKYGRGELSVDFSNSPNKPHDEDFAPLRDMTRLWRLMLDGCPITDGAIPYLAQLSRLRLLSVRGTQMTPAGVDELQRALPKTTIIWFPLATPPVSPPAATGVSGDGGQGLDQPNE